MSETMDIREDRMTMIARRAAWSNKIEIAAFVDDRDGKPALGQLVMTEAWEGSEIKPLAYLTMTQAQELMDTLYQAGVRPTRATETDHAALQATQDHLKDMQTLLGKQMDVNLGGKP